MTTKTSFLQSTLTTKRFISTTLFLNKMKHNDVNDKIMQRYKIYQYEKQLSEENIPTSYEVDSLLAKKYIEKNLEKFENIKKLEESIQERKFDDEHVEKPIFPFNFKRDPSIFKSTREEHQKNEPEEFIDRGFFYNENEFTDEYVAATTADLPAEEMTEPLYDYYNTEDAVEQLEIFQPNFKGKESTLHEQEEPEDDDWYKNYGAENVNVEPSTSSQCASCGAKFHCQDSALPGFVPFQLFKRIIEYESKKRQIYELCRRCYMLKNYNFLLNVNVSNVDYQKIMGHLKLLQEVLIILVVDMTDIHGSIYNALPKIIGDRKPMIVVGNKIDLLPPDYYAGYMKNWNDTLRRALKASGLADRFNILNVSLVSAKTGYGVEELITKIYTGWLDIRGYLRSDIYLIGCTNAGKSTLFNAFLQSDLCKVKAMDLVERVTTSIWPGTTLSLLKFPLMNPTAQRLEDRRQRLLEMKTWVRREIDLRYSLYERTKDPKHITLFGHIGSTFKEIDEENRALTKEEKESIFSPEFTFEKAPKENTKERQITLSHPMFNKGHWMYDTPGTALNLFTLQELINVIPRKMIIPRTCKVGVNESLLIGGVARIDLLSKENKMLDVFMTVFASDRLPLHVMRAWEVAGFMKRYNGTSLVGAPLGDSERLKSFPKLSGGTFEISGLNEIEGSTDIVLSSIGWVCITSQDTKIQLRVSTPGGKGIFIRQPPLLKYAINFRGSRIHGKSEYFSIPLKTQPRAIKPKGFIPLDPKTNKWELKEERALKLQENLEQVKTYLEEKDT